MQLDQILSAAVAAVNVEEVEQLPSPDIPQNSPTPPASARDHRALHQYLPDHGLGVTNFDGAQLEAQTEVERLIHFPQESRTQDLTDLDCKNTLQGYPKVSEPEDLINLDTKTAMQVYHEALQDAHPPPEGELGDMNFFALDDDNLVITSQQALEMFETPPAAEYGATYHVLTTSENPPQVNTPPMDVPGDVCSEVQVQEEVQLPGEVLLQEEIPFQEEVMLQGEGPIPTDVPVPSAEIEVLTTNDVPQYTSLTPASAATGSLDLLTPETLQCLPGTALDATVDAEGRFVVQVMAPGINMTVPNQYVSNEEIMQASYVQGTHQVDSCARQTQDPPSSTGPYTTYVDSPSIYTDTPSAPSREAPRPSGKGQRERASKASSNQNAQEPVRDRSDVLTALRESIFRSRAKKRGGGSEGDAEKPSKRRALTQMRDGDEYVPRKYNERHVGHRYVENDPPHYTYETTKRTTHLTNTPQPQYYETTAVETTPSKQYHHQMEQRTSTQAQHLQDNNNGGGMMVLRPEELPAALQRGGSGSSSSPLVVMRPEDLHAGAADSGDPLQVQLVYLVYPMDGAGSGTRQVPADMTPYRAFSRDTKETPSATNKQLSWLSREARHESQPALTPLRNSFEKTTCQEKSIAEWTYEDVVRFIFKAHEELNLDNKDFDVNFSELSGSTGKDLLHTDIEGFKRFSKGFGEQYYRYFSEKRAEEQRLELQRQEMQQREELLRQEERRQSLVSSQLYKSHQFSPSAFEYLPSPNNHSQAAHLSPTLPRDPASIMVETSAPYEIRYETHRPMGMENGPRSGISDALPTASRKSFPLFSASSPPNHYNNIVDNLSDPDHSATEEEEPKPEQPKKRGPGRPRKPENELKKKKKKTGRLWEFIRNLLLDPETCPSMVKWENAEEGIFKFVQAEKVAQRWGERKQNKDMNYEKLSRAMRYYYKGGVFEAVLGRRLVYKFGKNAKNWKPSNPNFANPPLM